ncbi:hypothetical protein RJ640_020492 [Escallonia rubra]|uniref:Pentatricopeptide repeat-containing protein n=1 Tax=Escallonia rubra TaxID=112253 RepID=A0AA88RES6_9ASTE|nr:hypothetical protein RJ640_020492 [Escallonia rubra]
MQSTPKGTVSADDTLGIAGRGGIRRPAGMGFEVEEASRILRTFVEAHDLRHSKTMHAKLIKQALLSSLYLHNNLLNMYAKCGHLPDALQLFDEMPHKNVGSWTAVIAGFVQKSHPVEALSPLSRQSPESLLMSLGQMHTLNIPELDIALCISLAKDTDQEMRRKEAQDRTQSLLTFAIPSVKPATIECNSNSLSGSENATAPQTLFPMVYCGKGGEHLFRRFTASDKTDGFTEPPFALEAAVAHFQMNDATVTTRLGFRAAFSLRADMAEALKRILLVTHLDCLCLEGNMTIDDPFAREGFWGKRDGAIKLGYILSEDPRAVSVQAFKKTA